MGDVAIIGAGPAGLSAARLLVDAGLEGVTVYERAERVGGKSLTAQHGGALHEMGTCYSTLAHYVTNIWMRRLGVRQRRLGRQMMDGAPYMEWVRGGPGEPLIRQGPRFVRLWYAFQRRLKAAPESPEVRAEAATPIGDWLEMHGLHRARRFMLRAVTNLGYGYLDEVSTVQALRWCTPVLLVTGLLNELRMPVVGWQRFWEMVADDLDLRLGSPVVGVERDAEGVTVTTPAGAERYKAVIVSVPPDEFAAIAKPSAAETDIAAAVDWGRYATTLCEVEGWFKDHEIECFSAALEPSAPPGAMLSARLTPDAPNGANGSGGGCYVTGQYGAGLAQDALEAALRGRIAELGARLTKVVRRRTWKYFPRYRLDAIREGLLGRMGELQGAQRTWWTGAAFSHEAVSNIVGFNVAMTRDLRLRV